MTTLIGIRAEKGNEDRRGIVLASDLQSTSTEYKEGQDVIIKEKTRANAQKIHVSDNKDLAVCMTGNYDGAYIDFLSGLLKGEIDFRKAAESGFFPELETLNLKRWGGRSPNDNFNALLVVTRYEGKPELFGCYPLGKIDRANAFISIGSGADYAYRHIGSTASKKGLLIPGYLALPEAVDLVAGGLEEASQDIHTGGIDLIIVTPKEIREEGKRINQAIEQAKAKEIQKIKDSLK